MSNTISFIGRVGSEPEKRTIGSHPLLEFSVANNVGYGDKKETNWFKAKIWGKRADHINPYLKKGGQVYVVGELTLRKYTDKNGDEKFSPELKVNELELIGPRDNNHKPSKSNSSGQNNNYSSNTDVEEDEMPF